MEKFIISRAAAAGTWTYDVGERNAPKDKAGTSLRFTYGQSIYHAQKYDTYGDAESVIRSGILGPGIYKIEKIHILEDAVKDSLLAYN